MRLDETSDRSEAGALSVFKVSKCKLPPLVEREYQGETNPFPVLQTCSPPGH